MKTTPRSKVLENRKASDEFRKSEMFHSAKALKSDTIKRQGGKFYRQGGKVK